MIPSTMSSLQDTMTSVRPPWESDLVEALKVSLQLAKEEYRIRIGLGHALQILEVDPHSVVMCILPINPDKLKNPLSHMQLLLIDAFCSENNIRMLKVQCAEDLLSMIDAKYYEQRMQLYEGEEDAEDLPEDGFEDGLVLIQESKNHYLEDQDLRKFYDIAAKHCHTRPIVRLRS
ncbi:hypothetical protein BV898_06110 [Hypsibius exemplaris]|uniref:Ribosomal protein L7Ae/L30e/S12e/Gadd45 domain-containing protein n=1 Tax=Hypsibius exemplaris TaxID=2072580 RepID=A0A1W0WXA8_HYPEX|nr:hypothetical protein BV898_06110 [Hypsibius exemplaris]